MDIKQKHIELTDYLSGQFNVIIEEVYDTKNSFKLNLPKYNLVIDGIKTRFFFTLSVKKNLKEELNTIEGEELIVGGKFKIIKKELSYLPSSIKLTVHKWILADNIRFSSDVKSNLGFCESFRAWFIPDLRNEKLASLHFSTGFNTKLTLEKNNGEILIYSFKSKYDDHINYFHIRGNYCQTVQHGLTPGGSNWIFNI